MPTEENPILFAFYGDDFTGATATAEALADSGVPTVLFAEPPAREFLAKAFPSVQAVGVAGTTRTLSPEGMEKVLAPAFETMKTYGAPILLYKVCSTFDSLPETGSIGRAIEIGRRVFAAEWVPVLPAAPRFRRFTVFGHHFASLGEGTVYRLDRHPSMSRHPVTPMTESDLRLHLSRQTPLRSGLIDVLALEEGLGRVHAEIETLLAQPAPIVLFDCLCERHLDLACAAIWERASRERPVFGVGSQEFGYGFGTIWREAGLTPERAAHFGPDEAATDRGPLLVISGSCATVTGEQILWAIENGFSSAEVESRNLLDSQERAAERQRVAQTALNALDSGRSVVVHTAIGPDDPRIDRTSKRAEALSLSPAQADQAIGDALGEIAVHVLNRSTVKRLVVAGGDSAGRIQKCLAIRALQVARPIGIAAPLCYAYSASLRVNGIEIAFKGGQAGARDYFCQARAARTLDFSVAALGAFPQGEGI